MLARDEHGNALGGIRWPDLEAPLGTHVGENLTDNIANVGGSSTPFPPEKVKALYPDHAAWFAKYQAAVEQLVKSEVVLPDDAATMIERAKTFELASAVTSIKGDTWKGTADRRACRSSSGSSRWRRSAS